MLTLVAWYNHNMEASQNFRASVWLHLDYEVAKFETGPRKAFNLAGTDKFELRFTASERYINTNWLTSSVFKILKRRSYWILQLHPYATRKKSYTEQNFGDFLTFHLKNAIFQSDQRYSACEIVEKEMGWLFCHLSRFW